MSENGEPAAEQEDVVSSSSENVSLKEEKPSHETAGEAEPSTAAPDTTSQLNSAQTAAPPAPSLRHDWYQTQADVYVNVMIKRLKREDVSVEFSEQSVEVYIRPAEGREHTLTFRLAHNIVPQKSSFKVLSTKVEIKMRKCEGLQWPALERPADNPGSQKLPQMVDVSKDSTPHKYPSSSHYTRDWDKLVAEVKKQEKDEKMEGDAAINQLFQQIYKDGNEETRKAMNKSFVESGGTVLSTNWNEVGEKKVEKKPPDGMEWKDYEV